MYLSSDVFSVCGGLTLTEGLLLWLRAALTDSHQLDPECQSELQDPPPMVSSLTVISGGPQVLDGEYFLKPLTETSSRVRLM